MTQGYQLRGFLRGGDACDARHFERIAFRVLRQALQHRGSNLYESMGGGGAFGFRLGGNVHHAHASLVVEVR
jgi:hypothetical protein